jgi:type IV pilus biogenesis protein PilP
MAAKTVLISLVVTALLLVGAAEAQDGQSDHRTTVGQLTHIQSQNLVKAALAEGAEIDKRIRDAEKGGGNGSATAPLAAVAPDAAPAKVEAPAPVVRGVAGANGQQLVATFLYAGGSTREARQGDHIPGGYVVKELTGSRVTLCRGGQCFDTPMSDRAPDMPVQQPTQASGNLVPPMPFKMN